MEPGTQSRVGRYVVGFFVLLLAVVLLTAWLRRDRASSGDGKPAVPGGVGGGHGR